MIKKAYVDTTDGQIHYRISEGGAGAPLVLLHMTAASSAAYQPLMEQLDGQLPMIAFDTVNYGESFRTTRDPTMAYIAEVLLEALTNLGIETFHTYGHHTGASVAGGMAKLAPGRVLSFIANGPNYTTAAENLLSRDRFAIPNPITIKGSQFIWAWSRTKDNFPTPLWGNTDVQAQVMHRDTTDLLRAGENWHWGYQAVFKQDLQAIMKQMTCPIFFVTGGLDLTRRLHERAVADFPDARVHVCPEAGVYYIETHPEDLAPQLIDFIKSVGSRPEH